MDNSLMQLSDSGSTFSFLFPQVSFLFMEISLPSAAERCCTTLQTLEIISPFRNLFPLGKFAIIMPWGNEIQFLERGRKSEGSAAKGRSRRPRDEKKPLSADRKMSPH
jgi:hypothetical protein